MQVAGATRPRSSVAPATEIPFLRTGPRTTSRFVGWDQRRFAAPAHHSMNNAINDSEMGGPALEASWSHPTKLFLGEF